MTDETDEVYPYPELRRLKWDNRYLKLAETVASWSKDPSTKVGAVITNDNRVIALGYNGLPSRVKDSDERLTDRGLKLAMTVHAEINAILTADRGKLYRSTLYTWPFMPCSNCAAIVIQSGVSRVVAPVLSPELAQRWANSVDLAKQMFIEAGVSLNLYTDKVI